MAARKPLVYNPNAGGVGNPAMQQVQVGDVLLATTVKSADAGNLLSVGSDGGTTYTGQIPQAAINIGDTTPDPGGAAAAGVERWSTTINEIVRWDGAAWGALLTSTSGAAVPSAASVPNGDVLMAEGGAPAWVNPNPFVGPIGGWPAIGGGGSSAGTIGSAVQTIGGTSLGPAIVSAHNTNAAQLLALQNLVALLQTQLPSLPVGAYVAPAAGQYQTYGTNASPWTVGGSSQGKANIVNAPYSYNLGCADILSFANGTFFTVTNDATLTATVRVYTITAGVPVLTASVALPMTFASGTVVNWSGVQIVSAAAISATAIKIVYSYGYQINGGNWWTDCNTAIATLSGSSLTAVSTSSGNLGNSTTNITGYTVGATNKRAFLCGASSMLAIAASVPAANSQTLALGGNLVSRGNDIVASNQSSNPNGIAWLGGGYFLDSLLTTCPSDNVSRTTFRLRYLDDQNNLTLSYVRMTGYTAGTFVGIWAFSNTLAFAQFKDGSGNQYSVALSISTGATPSLGVIGAVSNSGFLGTVSFWNGMQPLCWNAATGTDMWLYGAQSGTTFYLYRINFNTATNTLTCTARIPIVLGGASAGAQTAAIAGMTAFSILSIFQSGSDQITVTYSVTATTNGIWTEVINLA